jgi:hypothetical protein
VTSVLGEEKKNTIQPPLLVFFSPSGPSDIMHEVWWTLTCLKGPMMKFLWNGRILPLCLKSNMSGVRSSAIIVMSFVIMLRLASGCTRRPLRIWIVAKKHMVKSSIKNPRQHRSNKGASSSGTLQYVAVAAPSKILNNTVSCTA